MLGFRGHFSTKTRQYSTTLAQLRQARADYQRALHAPSGSGPADETTLVLSHWVFAGIGLTPELDDLATALTSHHPHPLTRQGRACRVMRHSELLTVPEVMAHLKVGRTAVYDLLRTHQLASITIGRARRIPAQALTDFIHRRLDQEAAA